MHNTHIPADVPQKHHTTFRNHLHAITHGTGKLFLFACDQTMEHLNDDFEHARSIDKENSPEYFFKIAANAPVGALATHLGLIARYAQGYTNISYIVKINGKTNRNPDTKDPASAPLYSVQDVLAFKEQSGIPIVGIGLTVYVGSSHENEMLSFAAQEIFQAHQAGLVAILWVYARGKTITDETDPHLARGLAGLGASLGADFIKIKAPHHTADMSSSQHLAHVVAAAGNSRIICSGGPIQHSPDFLRSLYDQLHTGGTAGCATGRNIFQHTYRDSLALAHAIAALIYDNAPLEKAFTMIMQ